jgi:regulator of sigma E protease
MNLLPIPALDGGHVVFLLVEMIKGKPLGDKFMERAQIAGFVILLSLMVFVLGNDIFKAVMS